MYGGHFYFCGTLQLMTRKELKLTFHVVDTPEGLDGEDRRLFARAVEAKETAHAPYSHFRVGAALLLENGEVVTGSNQENIAYPSGLCAERVAMFAAAAQHPGVAMVALAVATDHEVDEGGEAPTPHGTSETEAQADTISPCGGCRQVMVEYERKQARPLRVLCGASAGPITISDDAGSLMPLAFWSQL